MAGIGTVEGILRLRDEFTGTLTAASTQMQAAGARMTKTGQQMSAAGGAMTRALTLPIALVGGLAVKSFGDFDDAMTGSLAIMGDVSDAMREDMAESAREMAKETIFSASEAADSYFFLASAGLSAEASIAALPQVAKFAQAGLFDMATATDLATDAQSALGLTIRDDAVKNLENLTRVTDVLVKANTLANASVEQFSIALTSKAGAALKSFNIPMEEGVAVLAAFADQGVKAELAGNALDRILRLLPDAAIKNADAYERLGIEVFDASGNLRFMGDIIADLEDAFEGMTDRQKQAELTNLGFRAKVQGIIKPLLGTSDAIRRYNDDLEDAAGITQEVSDNQLESFKKQMGLIASQVKDVFITIGESLAPSIKDFADNVLVPAIEKLARFADWFAELPQGARTTAIALAGITAVAGPLLFVVGNLTIAMGFLTTGIASMGNAAVVATGKLGALWALLSRFSGAIAVASTVFISHTRALSDNAKTLDELREAYAKGEITVQGLLRRLEEIGDSPATDALKEQAEALRQVLVEQGALAAQTEIFKGQVSDSTVAVEDMDAALLAYADRAVIVKERTDELSQEVLNMTEEMQRGLEQAEALAMAHLQGADAVRDLEVRFEALNQIMDAGIEVEEAVESGLLALTIRAIEARNALDGMSTQSEVLTLDMSTMTGAFTDNSDAIDRNREAYELLGSTGKDLGRSQEDLVALVRELNEALDDGVITQEQFDAAMERLTDTTDESTDSFANWAQSFADAIAGAILDAEDLVDAIEELFLGTLKQSLTQFVNDLVTNFDETWGKIKGGFKNTEGSFKATGENMSGTMNAITAAFTAASGEWEDIAVGAMTAISEFANGNWVGAMIAAVGTVVGVFKKLFGDAKRNVTEEFRDMMAAVEQAGGLILEDFQRAAGLLVEVLEKFGGSTGARARQVLELLADNFDALVDSALNFGDAGLEAIAEIVEAAKAAGVDMTAINERLAEEQENLLALIEERNQFILDQAETIVSSIESMFTDMGNVTRREFEFAATSIIQAFDAMLAAGMPMIDVLDRLAEAIDLLEARGEELGATLPEEFQRFGEVLEILANDRIRNLIGRLEEMGAVTQAVGNLGLLTGEQFDTFGDRVDRAFKKLVKQGLTSEEAIAALAPQLQILQDMAEQYGFEIDNQTQSLLDQAIAQGVVTEKGLTMEDILIRGFDAMIEGLNALIVALGGVPIAFESIGESAQAAADEASDAADRMAADTTDAAEEITSVMITAATESGQAWEETTGQIPEFVRGMAERMARDLEGIPISFDFDFPPGFDGELPQAQHGTGGFREFGSGTLAVLHGREQVVTAEEGSSIAAMVASAIRGGGRVGQGGGLIEAIGDQSRVAEHQRNEFADAIRDVRAELRKVADEVAGLRDDTRAERSDNKTWA